MYQGGVNSADQKFNRKKRQIDQTPAVSVEGGLAGVDLSANLLKEAILTREQVMGVLTSKDIPDLEKARAEHLKGLYAAGEILPEDHAIFAKVKEIVDQLDMPDGTELIVTDNELFQAYFNPAARQIVVSRGVLQYFTKNLKNFSKDHLAALLAHETEHAVAYKDKKVHDVATADKVMATFDPAEELRADAEGMKRMAKGGFNPKAMIEILRCFGLTSEREGLMHPEIIDRVRYLDLRLVSDEHPLANTTKDFQKWKGVFLEWAREPSGVYDQTERLLAADLAGIDKTLGEAKTLNEFLSVYKYKHAYRLIGESKVAMEAPIYEELFRSMVVYKSLEPMRPQNVGYFGKVSDSFKTDKFFKLKKAGNYIKTVEKSPVIEAGTLPSIAKVKAEIDLQIDNILAAVVRSELSVEELDLLIKIEECRKSGAHQEELFTALMSSLNKEQVKKEMLEANAKRLKRGARAKHEDMKKIAGIDFHNAEDFAEMTDLYKHHLLLNALDQPRLEDADVALLSDFLIANGFEIAQAGEFSKMLLGGTTEVEFREHLKELSKEALLRAMRFFENNLEKQELRLSPIRSGHMAMKEAWNNFGYGQGFGLRMGYMHHFPNGGGDGMGSELKAVIYTIGWEYYTRGYESGYLDKIDVPYKSPVQVNLTEEEWQELIKAELPSMSEEVLKLAVLKIVRGDGDLSKISEFLLNYLKKTPGLPWGKENLKVTDFSKLLEHHLWDDQKTQKLMKNILEDYYNKITNTQDANALKDNSLVDLADLLKQVRDLAKAAPVKFTPKDRYDRPEAFSEDELSKMILHTERVSDEKAFFAAVEAQLQAGNKMGLAFWTEEMKLDLVRFDQHKWRKLLDIPAVNAAGNADLKMILKMLLRMTILPEQDKGSKPMLEKMIKEYSAKRPNFVFGDWLVAGYRGFSQLVDKLDATIEDKALRESYLMMAHDFLPEDKREEFYQSIRPMLTLDVDRRGRKNARYEYELIVRNTYDLEENEQFDEQKMLQENQELIESKLGKSIVDCSREEIEQILPDLYVLYVSKTWPEEMGKGLQDEVFADLMRRRFNFLEGNNGFRDTKKLVDAQTADFLNAIRYDLTDPNEQHFLAAKLREAETGIFASDSLEDRVAELLKVAPHQTVVRDIYLEKFAYDQLKNKKTLKEIIQITDLLWSLMSDSCLAKEALAIRHLDASFAAQPELLENAEKSMALIAMYLPQASFARNSYLDRIELKANLKVEQLKTLKSWRFSEEGKKDKEDNGIKTLITGKINEMNRQERMTFYFWLTGLKSKKPINILNLEREVYGDASSFKIYFASLKAEEQQLLVKRLCLGAEGIFDLEAMGVGVMSQAEADRGQFIEHLLGEIVGKEGEQAKFIKGILKTLLLSAEPAKSAEILSVLTSKFLEARLADKKINLPETVGMVLGSLGVVGKKLAQSLAELDFVPENYRQEFKKMQSAAQVVPKHALAELASFYGLLEGKDGLEILSFDRMLGAASNKQACLLEVEITDSAKWGLPLGVHKLVGKFKRPSAQKSANLDKDLYLVEKILSNLSAEMDLKKMPPGFIETLKDSVLRELNFEEEAKFAKHLRGDFAKLEQQDAEYKLALPKIIYSSGDLVLETLAPGKSLRDYLDDKEAGILAEGYEELDVAKISKKVLTEALRELLVSGNVHADLHPGNIFVDQYKQITFIDVGMNERLTMEQRNEVGKLLLGLAGGSGSLVKSSLAKLGMKAAGKLSLKVGKFENNVNEMINFAKSSGEKLPGLVSSLFSSISKLTTYSKYLKTGDMAMVLKEVGKSYGQKKLGLEAFDLDEIGL